MDGESKRSDRLRSFLIGGAVGASAALAAARRRRPRRAKRVTPAGLAAFEEAPCYEETLVREGGTNAAEQRRAHAARARARR